MDEDPGCLNLHWALALLEGLVGGGLRELVISPGSRSTPLVIAGQQIPLIRITPILDERSAAFYALGLAQATGRPVGLVCTSGSAAGHWLPAVMEAAESDLPLILLSADRPPELRGWGANQTLDQLQLFGRQVREFHDPGPARRDPAALKMMRALGARAAAVSQGRRAGPVHLNLPFREPLVPGPDCLARLAARPSAVAPTPPAAARPAEDEVASIRPAEADALLRLVHGRGLICCGPGQWSPRAAEALWCCAERLGVPVLCDPLSGLRFTPGPRQRIVRYDSLLRSPAVAAALRPEWILRFGRAPVSKQLLGWMADIPSILVASRAGWSDPTHDVRLQLDADPASLCRWLADADPRPAAAEWLDAWVVAEQRTADFTADYLRQAPWCEPQLLQTLLASLPAADALLCANSMPIRQLDTWSGARAAPLALFGNRGASGIDGQTSTLAGLNAAGLPTTGVLGDLSFLHDLSGLWHLRGLTRPCLVINNGGGRIFDYLPQQDLPDFARLWRTPLPIDLGGLLAPFGIPHWRVDDAAGFAQALAQDLAQAGREDGAGGSLEPGSGTWSETGPGAGSGNGSRVGSGAPAEPVADRASQPGAGVIEVCIDGERSRRVHQAFWRALAGADLGH